MKRRRLFQLSWLIVAAPAYFVVQQFKPASADDDSIEERLLLQGAVGPWEMVLTEESSQRLSDGSDDWVNDYRLTVDKTNREMLKAAFVSVGKPRHAGDGVVLSGGPATFRGELKRAANESDEIWLALEEWNGRVRLVKLPSL